MNGPALLGVGTDIVEIKRIKKAITQNTHFRERVFTPLEIAYCDARKKNAYASYAGIYAAKEAFTKALGIGFRRGSWHELEVDHTSLGAPVLHVKGTFKEVMMAKGFGKVYLSISHCKEYATCQIILQ